MISHNLRRDRLSDDMKRSACFLTLFSLPVTRVIHDRAFAPVVDSRLQPFSTPFFFSRCRALARYYCKLIDLSGGVEDLPCRSRKRISCRIVHN